TLWRMFVSRKHLLEWETAATTERRLGVRWEHFLTLMWTSPVLAAAAGASVLWLHSAALPAALPFLVSWFVAPGAAYFLSQPPSRRVQPLTATERQALRRMARKTWCFFETFVGDEDHWLPPDNFQEDPKGQLAHRTS